MKLFITQNGKLPVQAGGTGLLIEDLNYGIDGGLYAEMLENRNFEAKNAYADRDNFVVEDDGGYAWEKYPAGADVALKVKTDRPLFVENPHYMRLAAAVPDVGMRNKAYDGIFLTAKTEYKCSFYARAYDYKGKVRVGVYRAGEPIAEKKFKFKTDGKWHRYAFRFRAKSDGDGLDFCVMLTKAGTVHLDSFSLMPVNAVLGVFRRDLVDLMREIKPGFLRFPGGSVIEGNGVSNRYLWKNSVGQPERRKHTWNRWAVQAAREGEQSAYSHYGQTLGIGYYEYFKLAEYLGAKALPVVSLGNLAAAKSPAERDADAEAYLQEALDVIEFANGETNETVWGRARAEMGHPQPFGLEYLGVGNGRFEDLDQEDKEEFIRRFRLFETRIHERYPNLKLVATAGFGKGVNGESGAWLREELIKNPAFCDCIDEWHSVSSEWYMENAARYDDYERPWRVYAASYPALVSADKTPASNSWRFALAEAAYLTGAERNADVAVMKSYAPLFARVGYTQVAPGLIWFNGKTAFGSASYQVQKLFGQYTGDHALGATADGENVFVSATERDVFTFVKIVNAGDTEIEGEADGDYDFGSLMRVVQLAGDIDGYNSLEEPCLFEPLDVAPSSARGYTLPPHSFTVLIFKK